jgi:hypothetical protein
MAIFLKDQEKVDKFTFSYQETYSRIAKYYKDYVIAWNNMSPSEKANCHDVSLTTSYINSLPDESDDLFFVLEVAQLVRSSHKADKLLEFAYHITDKHSIKLGMYAEYLLKQFQIINSFK